MSKEMSSPSNNDDQRHQQRLSSSTVSSNASDGQDDDDTSHQHRRHPSSGDDVSAALHPPQVVSPAHLRPRNPLTVNTRHVGNHAHNHIHHGHHGQGSLRQHSVSPGGQATPAVVGTSTVSPPTGVIALSGSVGSSGSKTVTFFDQVPPPTPPPPFAGQLSGSTGQSSGPLDASATLPADDMSSSSPPSDLQRVRDLEHEVRELSRQLRLLRSREHLSAVSSVTSGHNIRPSSASSHMAPSLSSSFGGGGGGGNHVDPSTMSSSHRHAAAGSPTHSHHPSATTARSPSEPSSVAAGSMFPVDDAVPSSTTPYIMTSMHKPLVASTSGGTIIGLPVSYLDPNLAPYVVGLQNTNALLPQHAPTANRQSSTSGDIDNNTISSDNGGSDYHLVPCTVVERRMILFVAPASSRGSAAVFILCTHDGCLRRYTRSVWIEYRSPHESTTTSTLSYHAVNQLTQDLPLPSSATLVDPSENATENMEGLEDDEDDGESGAGDGASGAAGDEDLEGDDGGGSENASSVATWTTSNTNMTTANLAVQAAAVMHRALTRRSGGDDSASPSRDRQGSDTSLVLAHGGTGRAVGDRVAITGNEGMDRAHSMQHHLPLTREMLELFQPYVFNGGGGGHRGDMSQMEDEQLGGSAGVRTSVPPSECSELVADGDRSSVGGGGGGGGGRPTGGGSTAGHHTAGGVPRRSSGHLTTVSVTSLGSTGGGGGEALPDKRDRSLDKKKMKGGTTTSAVSLSSRQRGHMSSSAAPKQTTMKNRRQSTSAGALVASSISPRSARSPLSSSSLPPMPGSFLVVHNGVGSEEAVSTVSASSSSTSQ